MTWKEGILRKEIVKYGGRTRPPTNLPEIEKSSNDFEIDDSESLISGTDTENDSESLSSGLDSWFDNLSINTSYRSDSNLSSLSNDSWLQNDSSFDDDGYEVFVN